MNKHFIYRIIIDFAILFSIIHGWWFIALPLGLVALWLYPYYIEIILAGFLYDILFGLLSTLNIWSYIGTIISTCMFILITFGKKVVRG